MRELFWHVRSGPIVLKKSAVIEVDSDPVSTLHITIVWLDKWQQSLCSAVALDTPRYSHHMSLDGTYQFGRKYIGRYC